jgi:hypothetical protein
MVARPAEPGVMLTGGLEPFVGSLTLILKVPVLVLRGPPIRVFLEAGVATLVKLRPIFSVMVFTIM